MSKQKHRTAPIVIGIVLLVMVLLFVLFRVLFRDDPNQSITLPEAVSAVSEEEEPPLETGRELFVTVTPDNLTELLATLSKPEAYYQQLTLVWTGGSTVRTETVRQWKRGQQTRVVVTGGRDEAEKNYLFDGQSLWLWYTGDPEARIVFQPAAEVEELCAMPSVPAFMQTWSEHLSQVSYETADSGEARIFCLAQDGSRVERIWISLENGLPVLDQREDESGQYYQATQQDYRVLTPADEAYQNAFVLPQG